MASNAPPHRSFCRQIRTVNNAPRWQFKASRVAADMGSAGDVHPFIALGAALKARGHRATILTNPIFQPLIEAQGMRLSCRRQRLEQGNAAIANPEFWHLRKGFKVIAQVIMPAIEEIYRLIEQHADSRIPWWLSRGWHSAPASRRKSLACRALRCICNPASSAPSPTRA